MTNIEKLCGLEWYGYMKKARRGRALCWGWEGRGLVFVPGAADELEGAWGCDEVTDHFVVA